MVDEGWTEGSATGGRIHSIVRVESPRRMNPPDPWNRGFSARRATCGDARTTARTTPPGDVVCVVRVTSRRRASPRRRRGVACARTRPRRDGGDARKKRRDIHAEANADEDRRFAAPASDARGRARTILEGRDRDEAYLVVDENQNARCVSSRGRARARVRGAVFGRAAGRRPRRRPKLSEARSARLEDLSKIQFTSSHLTCRALSPSSRGRRRGSLPRCRAAASRPRRPLPRPPRRRPPRWTAA